MKKHIKLMAVALLATGFSALAQETPNTTNEVTVLRPVEVYVTQRMDSYPTVTADQIPEKEVPRGMFSGHRQRLADHLNSVEDSDIQEDPLAQTSPPTRISRAPIQNFPGIPLNVSPPDPSGAVGPNHYVQMTNGLWSVWDKQGVQASGFPRNLSDPLGAGGDGDPIVLYDREADRWLISEFRNPFNPSASRFTVAISNTPDPTGTYTVYSFNPIAAIDYPHFGIWGNSIVITGNFAQNGNTIPDGRMYAIDREAMLNGDTDVAFVEVFMPDFNPGVAFSAPQPAHSEGAGMASGPVPIVWMQDNIFPGVTTDNISVWDFDVDWSDPSTATVTGPLAIPIAPFDSFIAGTGNNPFANLDQPNTNNRIDALVNVVNYQTHRYDFGTHESIIVNFVVEVTNGSRKAGLRWIELRRTPGNDWELYQEGTFVDPTGDESVFMGAMGMDQEGNIAMGYIKTGNDTFPSLYYTGRGPNDPLGEMTIAEQLIIEGTNSVTTNDRYGDYGQLTRDPVDDLTFWYTSEYSGQPRRTQIASFKISDFLSVDELVANDSDFTVNTLDNRNFEVALRTESTNDILRLSVHNTLGQRVVYNQIERQGNTYRKLVDLSGMSSGVYIVTIGNSKTKLNKKIIVK
ncbi:T9SS type A sorting domain-containing protein [uncultured Dokdonia sp.]|uniref:T9SS type A sorting domain-containing protein n=1 Tax=uncultured Dokdonia sp. TaxID=575653 RepID=UPI00262E8E0D|nr:T9SS type A sorting domain-containing protein [uncultured Dokdonia sp.]